jgi:hypothetical protein
VISLMGNVSGVQSAASAVVQVDLSLRSKKQAGVPSQYSGIWVGVRAAWPKRGVEEIN